MEIEIIKVDGKIGKLYFCRCLNCTKYIVLVKEDTVTCPGCRRKYKVQYPEE